MKSVGNTDVHLSNGTTIPFAQNWRNAYTTMVGTEYKWFDLERLPAWEAALTGFLCKGNGHFLRLIECGKAEGGILRPKAIGLDVAYQAIFYETRTVSGNLNPVAIPGIVNGTYQTTLHVGMINLRANF